MTSKTIYQPMFRKLKYPSKGYGNHLLFLNRSTDELHAYFDSIESLLLSKCQMEIKLTHIES